MLDLPVWVDLFLLVDAGVYYPSRVIRSSWSSWRLATVRTMLANSATIELVRSIFSLSSVLMRSILVFSSIP